MIKRMRIWGFQKHKFLDVKFDPRVTTIIGATDVGKSSILRALGFIGLNRWNNSFLRHGYSKCKIVLEVDDKTLKRIKGKGVNKFYLDGKEFKAFSTSTPEEIEDLLKIGPENFQRQLDPHFWFTDTPGIVSKKLNRIVNLGTIDYSLSNVAMELRRARSEVEITEERLRKARDKKDELKWIVEFDKDLRQLESLRKQVEGKSNSLASVERYLKIAEKIRLDRERALNARLDGEKLITLVKRVISRQRKRQSLERLLKEASRAYKNLHLPIPDISELRKVRIDGDEVAEKRRNVDMLVTELNILEKELCQLEQNLKMTEVKYLKASKGKCPTCGKRLLQSLSQTSTCDTKHQSVERKKTKTGTK